MGLFLIGLPVLNRGVAVPRLHGKEHLGNQAKRGDFLGAGLTVGSFHWRGGGLSFLKEVPPFNDLFSPLMNMLLLGKDPRT